MVRLGTAAKRCSKGKHRKLGYGSFKTCVKGVMAGKRKTTLKGKGATRRRKAGPKSATVNGRRLFSLSHSKCKGRKGKARLSKGQRSKLNRQKGAARKAISRIGRKV